MQPKPMAETSRFPSLRVCISSSVLLTLRQAQGEGLISLRQSLMARACRSMRVAPAASSHRLDRLEVPLGVAVIDGDHGGDGAGEAGFGFQHARRLGNVGHMLVVGDGVAGA